MADANTKSVTAGLNYALSEASAGKPAYLQLSLQRYTGKLNADKSLANPDAWVDAESATVSVQTGKHEVYRFVNASVPTFALPLTGGTGNWTYMVVGGGILLVAILFTAWVLVRKFKTNR
ncbi:LPXTG cell wall anchor domain-containing protein [Arthrobacter alpinus]|nr:LPXTG cell wall anchor domain-containing protein [Arthrobacter alpinus]